jgi:hypothetical protein
MSLCLRDIFFQILALSVPQELDTERNNRFLLLAGTNQHRNHKKGRRLSGY